MDFNSPRMIAKYKTWVEVQVAFYDFLFEMSVDMPPEEFNRQYLEELVKNCTVKDRLYDETMVKINKMFETSEDAWEAFLNLER